jgi:propanol-preferring alcohol dehydrogenase
VLFLELPAGMLPYSVPFTLGHEIAGWVDQVGPGVDDLEPDAAVAVACMSTCGKCKWCRRGADNYCVDSWRGRGFGLDGGLASHLVVARRDLVPIGSLDPVQAAPLTDAGATSYHAVRRVLPKLRPGSTAVVIGVGGLGGYAIQWLRILSPARIIAVESRPERLPVAESLGADEVLLAGDGLSKRLREAIGGDGSDATLDFVGNDQTMNAAIRNAAPLGSVAIVGQGFGTAQIKFGQLAHDCDVFIPQGAPIAELTEVIALAQSGDVVGPSSCSGRKCAARRTPSCSRGSWLPWARRAQPRRAQPLEPAPISIAATPNGSRRRPTRRRNVSRRMPTSSVPSITRCQRPAARAWLKRCNCSGQLSATSPARCRTIRGINAQARPRQSRLW